VLRRCARRIVLDPLPLTRTGSLLQTRLHARRRSQLREDGKGREEALMEASSPVYH
jgi:hypothetical protein